MNRLQWSLVILLGCILFGCSETTTPPEAPSVIGAGPFVMLEPCGVPKIVTLWAGQFYDAGDVTISNDGDFLSVEINAANGWVLTQTHVGTARTLEDLPQTGSGNPQIGHFELSSEHEPPVTSYVYEVSLLEYGYELGDPIVLAVHAEVELYDGGGTLIQEETAWADGPEFPGRSWATYVEYTIQECTTPVDCFPEVFYPNGGELICLGQSDYILWGLAGEDCGAFVRIELLHYGSVCSVLAESAPNMGFWEWREIEACTEEIEGYAIRITDIDTGAFDESNETFTMDNCISPE